MTRSTIILSISLLVVGLFAYCSHPTETAVKSNEHPADECVQQQWLSLYPKRNLYLFTTVSNKLPPYEEVKNLILEHKVMMWQENKYNDKEMWVVNRFEVNDSLGKFGNKIRYSPYFDLQTKGRGPIKNARGEDSLRSNGDGSFSYIYDFPEFEPIEYQDIKEFRVKEELYYDSIAAKYLLKPTFLAFDAYNTKHNVLFWVRIDDLKEDIKVNTEWIDQIANSQYDGFIYKRYSCDDPDFKDD